MKDVTRDNQLINDNLKELDMNVNISSDVDLICSFCSKSRFEVEILIKGNDAFICDECVDVCVEIVSEESN